MKTLFIEAKADIDISQLSNKVKDNIKYGLITTIQHLHQLKEINQKLSKSVIGGQVLGCNVSNAVKIKDKVDAFLFIGSGTFHPLEIALRTGKGVYQFNPYINKISIISNSEIDNRKRRIKGTYLKYLNSKVIGLIVSTKKGQNNLKSALEFKQKSDKEIYIFVADNIDLQSLENFPQVECWINTACSRIALEDYDKFNKPIINLSDLKSQEINQ